MDVWACVHVRESVATITTERDTLRSELETVRQELELKKARIKELWRMNCEQPAEYVNYACFHKSGHI